MVDRIAELFGLHPDAPHLVEALTHPSYRNERGESRDNQRLEFLGDAVLGFCVTELLFARFEEADEGRLTRLRAKLVNARTLARWARENRVSEELRLGRGAAASGLDDSTNVLADAVEALIAAAYLDGGLEIARLACSRIVSRELESLSASDARDPKSELQERVQARGKEPPIYEVVESGGPPHDRWFVVSVLLDGSAVAVGRGRSKRTAEQAAAAEALKTGAWSVDSTSSPSEETEV
jgi:ribonuclease-3